MFRSFMRRSVVVTMIAGMLSAGTLVAAGDAFASAPVPKRLGVYRTHVCVSLATTMVLGGEDAYCDSRGQQPGYSVLYRFDPR
jgi:hypothetical protein